MRYIGVDPGSKFTGVAVLEEDGTWSLHGEYSEPVEAWRAIETATERNKESWQNTKVILEGFVGGGYRDEHITRTIKIVGYIEFHCKEAGYTVIVIPNQGRLANVKNVPAEITGKDERAAAAHALSARERKL